MAKDGNKAAKALCSIIWFQLHFNFTLTSAYEQVKQWEYLVVAHFKTNKMSFSVLSREIYILLTCIIFIFKADWLLYELWYTYFSKIGYICIYFFLFKVEEYREISSGSITSVKFYKALYLFIVSLWGYRLNFKKHKHTH